MNWNSWPTIHNKKNYMVAYNTKVSTPKKKQVEGKLNFRHECFSTHIGSFTKVWSNPQDHFKFAPTHKKTWGDNWKFLNLHLHQFYQNDGKFFASEGSGCIVNTCIIFCKILCIVGIQMISFIFQPKVGMKFIVWLVMLKL